MPQCYLVVTLVCKVIHKEAGSTFVLSLPIASVCKENLPSAQIIAHACSTKQHACICTARARLSISNKACQQEDMCYNEVFSGVNDVYTCYQT